MAFKSAVKAKLEKAFTAQTKKIVDKYQPQIVAVTGSVGKTSTKLAIATVLKTHYKVLYQKGNYNTQISVPFIFLNRELPNLNNPFGWFAAWMHGQKILRTGFDYEVVVVEIGTDYPGDVKKFESFLKPKIAVVSAVSEEHMEFFSDLEAVAAEELAIASYSKITIVNSDDISETHLQKYVPDTSELHSYGFGHAEYKITAKKQKTGYEYKISLSSRHEVVGTTPSRALHTLKPIAAAVAVADILEIGAEQIAAGIQEITPAAGRMQILKGINSSIIIDDSYNSSPLAAKAALDTLYDYNSAQKIAILGNMNELGNLSEKLHSELGSYCRSDQIDLVITIGQDANKYLASAAEQAGCRVERCDSPYKAGQIVLKNLKDSSVVLVKGSQNGVFSEEAIKVLLENKDDEQKLVRQSQFWLNKKRSQFTDAP